MHLRTKNNSSKFLFKMFSKNIFVLIFCLVFIFLAMSFIFSLGKIKNISPKKVLSEIIATSTNISQSEWILRQDSYLTMGNGDKIFIQLATSSKDQEQGLSGKEKLKVYKESDKILAEGMLFVFTKAGVQNFWMKDMNFDLDMIFLDDDKDVNGNVNGNLKIVHIEKNAKASSYSSANPNLSKIFSNGADINHRAKYVLEINAGLSDETNLKEGDIMLK